MTVPTRMHSLLAALRRRFDAPDAALDVLAALALKAVLLVGLYVLFFGPAHRVPADAAATAQALVGRSQAKDTP